MPNQTMASGSRLSVAIERANVTMGAVRASMVGERPINSPSGIAKAIAARKPCTIRSTVTTRCCESLTPSGNPTTASSTNASPIRLGGGNRNGDRIPNADAASQSVSAPATIASPRSRLSAARLISDVPRFDPEDRGSSGRPGCVGVICRSCIGPRYVRVRHRARSPGPRGTAPR